MRLVGLRAAGGYGKSALGAKLCETQTGFDQVLWVAFNQTQPFGVWSREVLRLLGAGDLEATLSNDQVTTFALNYLSQKRYLVVMDNLESLLHPDITWQDPAYEAFLLRWLEWGRQTVLLLTSREKPALPAERSRWRDLGGLTTAAGVALLKQRGISGSEADLAQFVELADGHPLLLNLTVGWLKNPRQNSAPKVKYALGADDLVRLGQIVGLHRGDKEASVATVLQETLARLAAPLQTLWYGLSVYNRAFDVAAAQAMAATTTVDVLYGLVDRSLLQELPQQQFEFLPLVQRFARQWATDLAPAHQAAATYYQERLVPLAVGTPPAALGDYFELFYHACELGEYAAAWRLMQQRTVADEQVGRYSSPEMFLQFQGSGADRLLQSDFYGRLVTEWQPQTAYERNLVANTLKAQGDVLQFLKQSREALANYEQALTIYREVGDRLGEANAVQGVGSLQDDPQQAMGYFLQAQEIFGAIGDRYSQGRNLLMFIVQAQVQLNDLTRAHQSLDEATAIGQEIGFELFCQYADQVRAQLNDPPQ
ncbi:MAG: hypothetical protein EA368_04175 [Leptolyngbya sp. DLM2.Bin27]|nr:MAG: hypothetical protein EA368_04175 [Leptolyngbya sp. DLM2.Bin27]